MSSVTYSVSDLLRPFDFGTPLSVSRIYAYLITFDAVHLPWYQSVSVLAHIANVALFASVIAQKIDNNGVKVDIHKVWLLAWLRDIGRVPWGIAVSQNVAEITESYGHHGYLGYQLLLNSGITPDYARISMTHIGSGITAAEAQEINQILGQAIFPVQDWYAQTLEEKIVVIADKIPGWHNTINAHYEAFLKGESVNNKIYSWLPDQSALWSRFWQFKSEVDTAAGYDVLSLFDSGILKSNSESYHKLPTPPEIVQMLY